MALFKKKKKANIKFVKLDENLQINVDEVKKLISNKTKIIALTHLSNVTGGITPLKEIIDLAKTKKYSCARRRDSRRASSETRHVRS